MRMICCVCGKEKIEGVWQFGEALRDGELPSSGYCPECMADLKAQDAWGQKLRKAINAKPQA